MHQEDSTTTMTNEQAYAAMFHFLEQHYLRTKSDDVGAMLGGMSLLADGGTADPAMMSDWEDSVRFACNGGKTPRLELSHPDSTKILKHSPKSE